MNSDIAEVVVQINKIIAGKPDAWLNISDYDLKVKDRKNKKSAYGLVHGILHHKIDDKRMIDRTHKHNLEYLYTKCVDHIKSVVK